MQEYLSFILAHWLMFTTLVIVLIVFIVNELYSKAKNAKQLTPQQVTRLINNEDAQIIDVRDKAEFQQGCITNATNIPMAQLAERTASLDKTKPIIVVCKLGQRAQTAAAQLKQQGFSNVSVLAGGLAAWRQAGLPVIKK